MTAPRTRAQIGAANRRAGRELERAAQVELEKRGWIVPLKAGTGQGGLVDVVALGTGLGIGMVLLVQCKTSGYVRPGDRDALREIARQTRAYLSIAYWHKDGRAAREVRFKTIDGEETPLCRP